MDPTSAATPRRSRCDADSRAPRVAASAARIPGEADRPGLGVESAVVVLEAGVRDVPVAVSDREGETPLDEDLDADARGLVELERPADLDPLEARVHDAEATREVRHDGLTGVVGE